MRSIVLGKLMGVSLELHYTFVWLIAVAGIALAIFSPESFFGTMMLLSFLFASVFLHELTHSIVAVKKGYLVEKIILLPIGGIAVTTDLPENPAHELQIAIAGPLFNFAVVAIISLLVAAFGLGFPKNWLNLFLTNPAEFENSLLTNPLLAVFYVNLMLGSFNLFFPALPLDGGRVLRSIAAFFLGFEKATRVVLKLSLFLGAVLLLVGFFSQQILLTIIALFIFFGSQQESELAEIKAALRGTSIKSIVEKKPEAIDAEASIEQAFQKMKKANKTELLVKKEKSFAVITLGQMEKVKKSKWATVTAKDIASTVPVVSENDDAARVFQKIAAKNHPLALVMKGKKPIGIVTGNSLEKLYGLKKLEKSQ